VALADVILFLLSLHGGQPPPAFLLARYLLRVGSIDWGREVHRGLDMQQKLLHIIDKYYCHQLPFETEAMHLPARLCPFTVHLFFFLAYIRISRGETVFQ
jgi:hypothetical protein